jgi:hypothetical protein
MPVVLIDKEVRVIGRSDLISMKHAAARESENPTKHQHDLDRLLAN